MGGANAMPLQHGQPQACQPPPPPTSPKPTLHSRRLTQRADAALWPLRRCVNCKPKIPQLHLAVLHKEDVLRPAGQVGTLVDHLAAVCYGCGVRCARRVAQGGGGRGGGRRAARAGGERLKRLHGRARAARAARRCGGALDVAVVDPVRVDVRQRGQQRRNDLARDKGLVERAAAADEALEEVALWPGTGRLGSSLPEAKP